MPAAMKKLDKKICDWSKRDLRESFDQLRIIVERPKFACIKCGRAASAKKWLCKPHMID
ncbi:MAG: hypothetical protein AAF790_05155 [Planctomycetota bacterium]